MIKILFVCHGSILKSPEKACKIRFHEAERHLLHHYYTIYIWIRALIWQRKVKMR